MTKKGSCSKESKHRRNRGTRERGMEEEGDCNQDGEILVIVSNGNVSHCFVWRVCFITWLDSHRKFLFAFTNIEQGVEAGWCSKLKLNICRWDFVRSSLTKPLPSEVSYFLFPHTNIVQGVEAGSLGSTCTNFYTSSWRPHTLVAQGLINWRPHTHCVMHGGRVMSL